MQGQRDGEIETVMCRLLHDNELVLRQRKGVKARAIALNEEITRLARLGAEGDVMKELHHLEIRWMPAEELLQQIKCQGYTKSGMRKAGQYCVQLYENDVQKLQGAGMLRPISEDIEKFFELVDKGQYTEEIGLDLGIESGMAVIM